MKNVYIWAGTLICITLLIVDTWVVNLPNLMYMIVAVFGLGLVTLGAFQMRNQNK